MGLIAKTWQKGDTKDLSLCKTGEKWIMHQCTFTVCTIFFVLSYGVAYFKEDSAVLVAEDSCSATYVVLSLISDRPLSPDLRTSFSEWSDLTSACKRLNGLVNVNSYTLRGSNSAIFISASPLSQ